jgi:hypothetical protein
MATGDHGEVGVVAVWSAILESRLEHGAAKHQPTEVSGFAPPPMLGLKIKSATQTFVHVKEIFVNTFHRLCVLCQIIICNSLIPYLESLTNASCEQYLPLAHGLNIQGGSTWSLC